MRRFIVGPILPPSHQRSATQVSATGGWSLLTATIDHKKIASEVSIVGHTDQFLLFTPIAYKAKDVLLVFIINPQFN